MSLSWDIRPECPPRETDTYASVKRLPVIRLRSITGRFWALFIRTFIVDGTVVGLVGGCGWWGEGGAKTLC